MNGQVYSIASADDKIWFATPSGLTLHLQKEKTNYNFNILDGLIENHSMLGHYKDGNGDVYFAGAGGYHKIKSEEKYLQKETKNIMLSQLKINNKQIFVGENDSELGYPILTEDLNGTDEITLSYYHKNIVFDFSAQDFISPHQYEYSYVLEGISEDWINLGQEQKIMFSQLPEQNFKLGIKAKDQFGNATQTKYLSIKVNIPFWKHPLTFIVLGLLFILAIYLGMKFQERKVKLRNIELEKAVQQRTLTLKAQNKKLETYIESNMKLENFAHAASHDLKAPMNNIAAFAGLLKEELDGKIGGEANIYFAEIERGTSRLNDLIDDILAYSTLKSENVNFTECSIPVIIKEVLHSLDSTIKTKNAIVQFEQKQGNKIVLIDKIKISRVVQNLITNALKFIPNETVPNIKIWVEEDNTNQYIHIKDNGIGISKENQSEIFKMFKRVGHTHNYDGTGFGLAISKKIMDLHQGDLKVTSILSKGSTFTLSLPKEVVKVTNGLLPQQRAKTS